eukprot:3940216-Ditylum_brightwellii.AAC.1
MNLKEEEITIASLDVENMYPLTYLSLIKQAICHYGRNLSREDKLTLESCLSMIVFGMQTTLTRFRDRYFNYRGVAGEKENEIDEDNNGLTIGSFKSAFCADLCATYIFEMRERCFHYTKFKGIYRDDGLVIFLGKLTQLDLAK